MRMSHFIVRDAIIPSLTSTTKPDVIRELVRGLHAAGEFLNADLENIIAAVMSREQLGSTGIGRSIAIPHTRHSSVRQLVGTIGVSKAGVAFDSIDEKPVHVFALVVSPQDRPRDHLCALECIVQVMGDDERVKAIREAETQDRIWALIDPTRPPS